MSDRIDDALHAYVEQTPGGAYRWWAPPGPRDDAVSDQPRFGVRWSTDDAWVEVIDNHGNRPVVARLYWPTFPSHRYDDLWDLGVLIAKRYEAFSDPAR